MKTIKIIATITDPETIADYYDEADGIILDDFLGGGKNLLDTVNAKYAVVREGKRCREND